MNPKAYNIEELRCNTILKAGRDFYICRYEDFTKDIEPFQVPHRHNYYMTLVATLGEGSHLIDFKDFPIKKGTVSLMYPGMIHAWQTDKNLKGYLIFFNADFFSMRYHDHELSQYPFYSTSQAVPVFQASSKELEEYIVLLESMLEEYENTPTDYLRAMRSLLNVFLIKCKRKYEKDDSLLEKKDKHNIEILKKFEQLVEGKYATNRLVKDYANVLLLTPNYLNSVCKKSKGVTAGEIIRERIMLEARRLLIHDGRSIKEIAGDLGFEDVAYFSRFFKKYEKISPEQFRKKYLTIII